jgi:hypothetical protein
VADSEALVGPYKKGIDLAFAGHMSLFYAPDKTHLACGTGESARPPTTSKAKTLDKMIFLFLALVWSQ